MGVPTAIGVHQVATPFGVVAVRLPRFRCYSCRHSESGTSRPSHCRSTPELDQLRAHLSALLPYRAAAGVLTHLLPVDAGTSPETMRTHTLKIGEQLRDTPAVERAAPAWSITVTVDSTFICGRDDGERHLGVRIGNVETSDGRRQVFSAVARTDTDTAALIRRSLETVGQTADTVVSAFTDGCAGLCSILTAAGVTKPPIADWFHIAMRLQHAKLAASGWFCQRSRHSERNEQFRRDGDVNDRTIREDSPPWRATILLRMSVWREC